eukprot:Gregarina_sp_Poly_1__2818@NODE_1785_length_3333_cov_19_672382_g1162_i0_p1_GENE_NODE_1785_length_3333_cov_19_672382_g1162_i0NODE_1785_length_3333_cov_19_672382_g1162_i0_p1_ORF_typecomplete_len361_score32_68PAZ/PF02170_22/9_2e16ArgoN/PF16486_5/1_2e07_NODE_1785_length_3333_cov_19_672382_g1162_i010852167
MSGNRGRGGRGRGHRGGQGDSNHWREGPRGRGEFRGRSDSRGAFRGGGQRGGTGAPCFVDHIGPIDLLTNHFQIVPAGNSKLIYRHQVEIEQAGVPLFRERNEKIIDAICALEKINLDNIAYDGQHILLILHRSINIATPIKVEGCQVNVCIHPQGPPIEVRELFNPGGSDTSRTQMLEIIMKRAAKEHSKQFKAQSFATLERSNDPQSMIDLGSKMTTHADTVRPQQLWLGHFQTAAISCRGHEQQATLCINAAATVAYPEMPLTQFLRGLKFEVRYFGDSKRTTKLCGISDSHSAANYKFSIDDGQCSVEQYFLDKYKMKLKFPHAPLVKKAPKNRDIFLPVETVWLKRQSTCALVTE